MLDKDKIIKKVEAILFVSGEPVETSVLSEALLIEEEDLKEIIEEYALKLIEEERGIKIVRLDNKFQMTTNEKYFNDIEKIYKNKALPKLSESVLETLAIISFKQPITKAEVNKIRGVSSDYNINRLLEYNIVREVGRSDTPGRPILFGTTDDFLKFYGISSISEFTESNQLNLETYVIENDIELES